MHPLLIQAYSKNKFTVFKNDKFLGWIIGNGKEWEERPSNTWDNHLFESKAKAVRYLLATLKK